MNVRILSGFFGLFLLATVGVAQPVADLVIEFVDPLPEVTPPGSSGNFSFRVTNLGPDRAGREDGGFYVVASTNPIDYLVGAGPELFMIEQAFESDCIILTGNIDPIPGNPPQVIYSAEFQTLDPGETAFCKVFYRVSSALENDRIVRWRTFTSIHVSQDPNQDNNYIYQLFRIAPPAPIPTLTPVGVVAFVLGLLVAFAAVRRRL